MKSKFLLILLLVPLFSFCQKKRIKLLDIKKNKKTHLKVGNYTGLITTEGDTLEVHRYRYTNKYKRPNYFNEGGLWKITKIDNQKRYITLTGQCKRCGSRKYFYDDIEYIYFPKEVDTRHRELVFWCGVVFSGIGAIVTAIESKGENWKTYGIYSIITISSSLYVLGPGRKRLVSRRYRILN